jgi:hypothetical protein
MLHKKNGQRRYKYLVLGRDKSYFLKTNNLILPKGSLKLVSSKCSIFGLTTYLLRLVDVFFTDSQNTHEYKLCSFLVEWFLSSYDADFIQGNSQEKRKEASPIL